jgi:redox-sensitive bicupin YhaK (pirin superfamily)
MIKHIPFDSLYHSQQGWLKSRYHFSFAEYHNTKNTRYGVLRVLNDDLIAPHSGFGMHPHSDMEIISYVVDGALTHEDNLHNKQTLHRGDMQYMSAGTGVTHSEVNDGDKEVRLLQLWIYPETKGLKPDYGSKTYDRAQRYNHWLHLAGPKTSGADVTINQDANVYVSEFDAGETMEFQLAEGRQAYLKLIEGSIELGALSMQRGDAAEVYGEPLKIKALEAAHLLLVEMKRG